MGQYKKNSLSLVEAGIGMYLAKAHGKGSVTATSALLMAFAMVINQTTT